MPHHAKASGWTSEGSRMWFHRCDQCGKRRLVDTYFEIYPPLHSKGDEAGWWWACASCLVSIISDQLEAATETVPGPSKPDPAYVIKEGGPVPKAARDEREKGNG